MELIVKEIEGTFTLEVPNNITLRICDEIVSGPTTVTIPYPKLIEKELVETVDLGYEHKETKEIISVQDFVTTCKRLGGKLSNAGQIWETIEEKNLYYNFYNSYSKKTEIRKNWVPVDFKVYQFAKSDNPMIKSLRVIANAKPAFSYSGDFWQLFKKANEITQANYTWDIKLKSFTQPRIFLENYSKLNGAFLIYSLESNPILVGTYEECQAAYEKDITAVVNLFRMTQAKQLNTQVTNIATIYEELNQALNYTKKIGYNKRTESDWKSLHNKIISLMNQLNKQANGFINS